MEEEAAELKSVEGKSLDEGELGGDDHQDRAEHRKCRIEVAELELANKLQIGEENKSNDDEGGTSLITVSSETGSGGRSLVIVGDRTASFNNAIVK